MTKMSKPILFFGSGPVAAESLRLLAQDFTIEGVITKPRAAHHRGDVPVLRIAEELSLPTHTVSSRHELDILVEDTPFKSELGVLIDFGIIVSQKTINHFPLGIVNSHFSLLPQWRGADPITFSVLSGQRETGVSLMLLTAGMDEGPVLAYATHGISHTTTTATLTHDLIELSYSQLKTILPMYVAGEVTARPQDPDQEVTYSRKLTKDDGILDWDKPAAQIEREIRAFIEWPKSHAYIKGTSVIITAAHVVDATGTPGTFGVIDKQLAVYCASKALIIDRLKPAGKKEMTGQSFLAGYKHLLES